MHGDLTAAVAGEAVRAAARDYFAARRAGVAGFVDRHFSLAGSARLHRVAFGWDILRAPVNVALALPYVAVQAGALAARVAGAPVMGRWLADRRILRQTAVAREVEWRIVTELLELPLDQGDRRSTRDGLAEAILAHPAIAGRLADAAVAVAAQAADPGFRARMDTALTAYAGTRAAAAEITTALVTLGTGAALFQQATPGMFALGPVVATALAQTAAVSAFPLGAAAGGLWYSLFPAAASPALVAGTTGTLIGAAAVAGAFAGVLSDPVQRALGIHQRRLARLIDTLERQFAEGDATGFVAHDHYVARLLDLSDILIGLLRGARG